MGNGALAREPQATAPILDSTIATGLIWLCSLSGIWGEADERERYRYTSSWVPMSMNVTRSKSRTNTIRE
jgi:hypothetical protein